jgi:hypothetical protein
MALLALRHDPPDKGLCYFRTQSLLPYLLVHSPERREEEGREEEESKLINLKR